MAEQALLDLLQTTNGYIGRDLSGNVPTPKTIPPGTYFNPQMRMNDRNVPISEKYKAGLIIDYHNGEFPTLQHLYDAAKGQKAIGIRRGLTISPRFEHEVLEGIGFRQNIDGSFSPISDAARTPSG